MAKLESLKGHAKRDALTGCENSTSRTEVEWVATIPPKPEPTLVDLSIQAVGAVKKIEDILVKLFLLCEAATGTTDIPEVRVSNPLDQIKDNLQSVIEISERVADIIQRELVNRLR